MGIEVQFNTTVKEGYETRRNGEPISANPYFTEWYKKSWNAGWNNADKTMKNEVIEILDCYINDINLCKTIYEKLERADLLR